jgi:multidrug efflux pump subunit AcrB
LTVFENPFFAINADTNMVFSQSFYINANAGASFIPSPAIAVIGGFLIALPLLLIVLPSLLMKFVST